jgi:hypothetical protein
MSQAVELRDSYTEAFPSGEGAAFEYRPVPVLAVIAMVLGVLSLMSFFGITGMVVAALGVMISLLSLFKIVRSRGELGGRRLAILGLLFSTLFLGSGMAYQRHLYLNEVPGGFTRTNFTEDISKKPFVTVAATQDVHPDVKQLVGKPIFLKGFMYPTGQNEGLDSFLLVKDSGACCFGGKPALTDMIGVVMQDQKTVDYYPGRVSVSGEFELNTNYRGAENEPIYLMKAKIVTKSQTAF